MKTLQNLISPLSISDARASLYYLSRYLKQAASLGDDEKDIFEDEQNSAPGDFVVSKTRELINHIEKVEGKPAKDFDDETYLYWADHIYQIESELDPDPTEEERQIVENIIGTLKSPPNSSGL